MEQRFDMGGLDDGFKAVFALEQHVRSKVPIELLELVKLRASLLNGCAFCIDMHSTEALGAGEDRRRLFAVAAWKESSWFDDDERAALALTDAVTDVSNGVSDEVWAAAVDCFGTDQAAELVLAIATINVWNRLAVTARTAPPELVT